MHLEPELRIRNVLALANVGVPLDLSEVVKVFKFSEFDNMKFSSVRIRLSHPMSTVSIYASGKIHVSGARSHEDAIEALKIVAHRIKKRVSNAGGIRLHNFKVENVLATCNVGFAVNLQSLSEDPRIVCTFDPTRFSAVVVRETATLYRNSSAPVPVAIDVHSSGSLVLKGASSKEELEGLAVKVARIASDHAVRLREV